MTGWLAGVHALACEDRAGGKRQATASGGGAGDAEVHGLRACVRAVCEQAADKCIELEPTFAKGYSRKGTLQFFMKVRESGEHDGKRATRPGGLAFVAERARRSDRVACAVTAVA